MQRSSRILISRTTRQTRSIASASPWPTPTHMVAEAFLAAGLFQVVQRRHHQARPAHAQGMAEGDGTAVRVDLGRIVRKPQIAQHRQALAGEDFRRVPITSKSATARPRRSMSLRTAGTGPTPITRGATPALAMRSTLPRGVRPCFFTASADARISAAAPSLTPEALPAVTVLSGPIDRFEFAQGFQRGIGARMFVLLGPRFRLSCG